MSYYDTGLAFSPEGHLLQVEYARQAVNKSRTTIVVPTRQGILIIYQYIPQDHIIDQPRYNKIRKLDSKSLIIVSGRNGDSGQVLALTSQIYREHILNYGESPNLRSISESIRKLFHTPTISYSKRPYGCNAVIAGQDEFNESEKSKYLLYLIDADGSLLRQRYTISGIDKLRIFNIFSERFSKNKQQFTTIEQAISFIKEKVLSKTNLNKREFNYYKFSQGNLTKL
jgi:20S proteasome alpha/beta subunit